MAFVRRQAHGTLLTDSSSWETLENRELLKAAEAAGFDVLLTPDKNIRLATRNVTAPACGACRRCRQRGETGQLHGSRNTSTLIVDIGCVVFPILRNLPSPVVRQNSCRL